MRSRRTATAPIVALALVALALVALASPIAAQADLPASLGATVPEFVDGFDEAGLWGLPDTHGSTVYAESAIEMSYEQEGWMWGWRELAGSHHPVIRVQGTLVISGPGVSGGWMCGTASGSFGFGVIDSLGGWSIGQVIDGEVTVQETGEIPADVLDADGAAVLIDVECAQMNVDVTQVLLSVRGVTVGTASIAAMGTFGRAAFVGASPDGTPGTIRFDDAAVWTGPRYAPSDEPGPTAGPVETLTPVVTLLGADTIAFEDDFSGSEEWGTGAGPQGFVAYTDEQLAITIVQADSSRWSWRTIDTAAPVLRVEGAISLGPSDGSAAWMCGTAGDAPDFLLGGIGPSDSWTVGWIVGGAIEVLERGTLADPGDPGLPREVVLECGLVEAGTSRIVLWVDGEQVADLVTSSRVGPFDKAGAAASAPWAPFHARFDDTKVSTGAAEVPGAG